MRYTAAEHDVFARDSNRDSLVVLQNHFPSGTLERWREAFQPLLEAQMRVDKDDPNRGPQRFYVTLPFQGVFADAAIYENPDVLAIVTRVAGPEPVLCQLATDTPLRGSDYQAWHADTPALFPELGSNDTPSFQIAVNFALCDVGDDNGPFETTLGTHRMNKEDAMAGLASGASAQHRYRMAAEPARGADPGPAKQLERLSPTGRRLLRFNPVVPDTEALSGSESYRAFAY